MHRTSCPARACAAGVCDLALGDCTFIPGTDGAACDDGNGCTQTDVCISGACVGQDPVMCAQPPECHVIGTCDPATGVCSDPLAADGTACSDGNSCAADVCVSGQCIESATCDAVVVPEVVVVANVKKVKVVAAAEGRVGDIWRAQGFVDSPAEATLSTVASQLSADDAKTSCDSIKPIQEVTNKVKARVGNKGRVKLKLKLNPIGRCLLAASATGNLTVRVEATIIRKNPQPGEPKSELLNRLVRIVRGAGG